MSLSLFTALDTPWYLAVIYGTLGPFLVVLLVQEVSRLLTQLTLTWSYRLANHRKSPPSQRQTGVRGLSAMGEDVWPDIQNPARNHGKDPVYLKPLIHHLSINTSLTLNYGTWLLTFDFPLFREIFEVEAAISKFRSMSEHLADFFPFLRYNPFSGQSKYARDIGNRCKAVKHKLLDELQERIQ